MNYGVDDGTGNKKLNVKRDIMGGKGNNTIIAKKGDVITQSQAENNLQSAYDDQTKSVNGVIKGFEALNSAIKQTSDMFEKLGMSGASKVTDTLGAGISGATSMGGSMKELGGLFTDNGKVVGKLGMWGAAAGAAMGIVGQIASIHDQKLNKAIERSQQRLK